VAARKKLKQARTPREEVSADSAFPYCTAPSSLRRFLTMVPGKPKPPKVTTSTLQTWGLKSGNDSSILRVLKKLDLLGSNNETTQTYADFMRKETGPATLGRKIKAVYEKLFETVSKPETAPNSELINFFNINSGGGERAIRYQVDTFKALAEHATFGHTDPLDQQETKEAINGSQQPSIRGDTAIRIDLHIHLIEAKFVRDAAHGKQISKELHTDIETYRHHPNCDHLIFFIYDPDSLIPDVGALEREIRTNRVYDGRALYCHLVVRP